MSLAIYAAPFDESDNNQNYMGKKRMSHNNKTQKRYPKDDPPPPHNANKQRVMSVLQSIQNMPAASSEEELTDYHNEFSIDGFRPPPPPSSIGVMKTEPSNTNTNTNKNTKEAFVPSSLQTPYYSDIDVQSSQDTDSDFYKRYIPNYNELYKQSGYNLEQNSTSFSENTSNGTYQLAKKNTPQPNTPTNNNVITDKLNYMIHLLEEQQDERTNNITEEVLLYSFLGIFIIFIVDSFARVGKYTR